VVKAFVGAQLFVAPSVTGSDDDQEGIPNVLKEAMAIGVPVVATRHSGIPELIENGVSGYLAPEKDVDMLADGMQRILENREDTDSMTRRAREKILREFDNDKLNSQLELIYQQRL
jgi:colanic acid/amylovoran biosynthesis glycosyltransferase